MKIKIITLGILTALTITGLVLGIANGTKKESVIKPEVKQIKAEIKEKKDGQPKSMLYFAAGKRANDIKQKEIAPEKTDNSSYSYNCKDKSFPADFNIDLKCDGDYSVLKLKAENNTLLQKTVNKTNYTVHKPAAFALIVTSSDTQELTVTDGKKINAGNSCLAVCFFIPNFYEDTGIKIGTGENFAVKIKTDDLSSISVTALSMSDILDGTNIDLSFSDQLESGITKANQALNKTFSDFKASALNTLGDLKNSFSELLKTSNEAVSKAETLENAAKKQYTLLYSSYERLKTSNLSEENKFLSESILKSAQDNLAAAQEFKNAAATLNSKLVDTVNALNAAENNIKEMKTDGLLNIKTDDIIKNFKNYKTLEKLTAVLSE